MNQNRTHTDTMVLSVAVNNLVCSNSFVIVLLLRVEYKPYLALPQIVNNQPLKIPMVSVVMFILVIVLQV
jgi:hypothetical protein